MNTQGCVELSESNKQRFWRHVDQSGKCWEWKASLTASGYGKFKIDGKSVQAHRVAYQISTGKSAEGFLVTHTCDNKKCVNPDHLRLGTHSSNAIEAYERGPLALRKGELHHRAKLSAQQVVEIRNLYKSGIGYKKLAKKYGVDRVSIRSIVKGELWKHV